MPISYQGEILKNLELKNYESRDFIRIFSDSRESYIDFEYFFGINNLVDSDGEVSVDYNDYKMFILNNNYLNAEQDFFQVFDKNKNQRIGWIFTIGNLESKDFDIISNKHLNKYKLIAYHLLLQAKDEQRSANNISDNPKISDIYPEDSIILILFNSDIPDIDNFSIVNYLPSLSKYGYYTKNNFDNKVKISSKNELYLKVRHTKKIYTTNSKIRIEDIRFIYELFSYHLQASEHPLLRFHMLYQVIEYYLSAIFEKESEIVIQKLIVGDINKNDFIEKISDLKSERKQIRGLITQIDDLRDRRSFDSVDLIRDCKALLEIHNKETNKKLGDLIYNIRNLVVHDYRSIEEENYGIFESIINQFELLIISIIENYELQV